MNFCGRGIWICRDVPPEKIRGKTGCQEHLGCPHCPGPTMAGGQEELTGTDVSTASRWTGWSSLSWAPVGQEGSVVVLGVGMVGTNQLHHPCGVTRDPPPTPRPPWFRKVKFPWGLHSSLMFWYQFSIIFCSALGMGQGVRGVTISRSIPAWTSPAPPHLQKGPRFPPQPSGPHGG